MFSFLFGTFSLKILRSGTAKLSSSRQRSSIAHFPRKQYGLSESLSERGRRQSQNGRLESSPQVTQPPFPYSEERSSFLWKERELFPISLFFLLLLLLLLLTFLFVERFIPSYVVDEHKIDEYRSWWHQHEKTLNFLRLPLHELRIQKSKKKKSAAFEFLNVWQIIWVRFRITHRRRLLKRSCITFSERTNPIPRQESFPEKVLTKKESSNYFHKKSEVYFYASCQKRKCFVEISAVFHYLVTLSSIFFFFLRIVFRWKIETAFRFGSV